MRTVGYWPGAVMPAGLDVRSSAGRSRAFPKGIGVSFPLLIRLSVIADESYPLPGADTTFRPGRIAGATVSRSPQPAVPRTADRGSIACKNSRMFLKLTRHHPIFLLRHTAGSGGGLYRTN